MANITDYLLKIEPLFIKYLELAQNYINSLDTNEVMIIIFITAVLTLLIAYRLFGIGFVIGLLVVYALAYILFINNIFGLYQQRTSEETQHMKAIQEEIQK